MYKQSKSRPERSHKRLLSPSPPQIVEISRQFSGVFNPVSTGDSPVTFGKYKDSFHSELVSDIDYCQ